MSKCKASKHELMLEAKQGEKDAWTEEKGEARQCNVQLKSSGGVTRDCKQRWREGRGGRTRGPDTKGMKGEERGSVCKR